MSDFDTSIEQLTAEIADENTEQQAGAEPESPAETVDENANLEQEQEGQPETPPTEGSGFQKRINKLTADKYEARRRADELQAELERLRQASTGAPATPDAAPTLEQFDYDEQKYQEALVNHRVEQAVKEKFSLAEQERAQRRLRQTQEEAARDFSRKVAQANLPNYAESVETLSRAVTLPPEAVSAIQQLENGPEVVVYLSQHLDAADVISQAGAIGAAVEIGMIGARLAAGKKNPPQIPKAPPPITPVRGGGAVNKSVEDMSMEEIMNLDD